VVLEILDIEPDWQRFVHACDRLTRRVPRLRERVVEPALPVITPTWSVDPHFDLGYHVQHIHLPDDGSFDDLHAIAAVLAARPLDPQRPPWEVLLVGGLPDGQAAFLFKGHHSLTDGLGMMQLLDLAHAHGRESGAAVDAEATRKQPRPPAGDLVGRVMGGIARAPEQLARAAANVVGRVARNPVGSADEAIKYGLSLSRVLAAPAVRRSPLLRDGGVSYRFATIDVPLAELKSAGKRAAGTVNDAFLAGLLGGIRRYHEHHGISLDQLPMAIPVSVRDSNDPMGGNRFAAARFIAPIGESDPSARIAAIHQFVTDALDEPALNFVEVIAPVLNVLPAPVLTQLAAQMTTVNDLQASNMGVIKGALYLAGAKVLRLYVVGPRPGIAVMATMVSYGDTCCIGLNFDPTAIHDEAVLIDCMRDGFGEVLGLGLADGGA
jgi:WS/DGAT/MGAT family acyltransferase